MSHTPTQMIATVAADPVCGSELYALMAPANSEHDGRAFYFCSEHCRMLFESHPERYVKTGETDGPRP